MDQEESDQHEMGRPEAGTGVNPVGTMIQNGPCLECKYWKMKCRRDYTVNEDLTCDKFRRKK